MSSVERLLSVGLSRVLELVRIKMAELKILIPSWKVRFQVCIAVTLTRRTVRLSCGTAGRPEHSNGIQVKIIMALVQWGGVLLTGLNCHL